MAPEVLIHHHSSYHQAVFPAEMCIRDRCKVVVWLVPSEPILNQTIKNLSDTNHPYRQKLEHDFAGRVGTVSYTHLSLQRWQL